MKNFRYLILFVTLSLTQTSFAQENKFRFTFEMTPNFSGLTHTEEISQPKLSHNSIIRVAYNTTGAINPTVGLGFLNTGEIEFLDFSNQPFQGQIEIENAHNFNYLYIPFGAKINISKFYLLPEIGFGVNVSNRTKEITRRPWINNESTVQILPLNSDEINAFTIPLLVSIGRDFECGNYLFSSGLKGYYGLNQVTKDGLRKDHYFGLGLTVAIHLKHKTL